MISLYEGYYLPNINLLKNIIQSSNTSQMQNSQIVSSRQLHNSQSGGNLCSSSLNKHLLISRTNQSSDINNSLKKLHDNLKFQLCYVSNRGQSGGSQIQIMRKKEKKLQAQVQHMTTILNILISANNKLKNQVNNSRNSRVIYSTVFKNFQKEIHKQQDSYKMALLETLFLGQTSNKIQQKLLKSKKKIEKQIRVIEKQISLPNSYVNDSIAEKQQDQFKKSQNNKKVFLKVQGQQNQNVNQNLSSVKRVKNKSTYQEKDQESIYQEQSRKMKIDNLVKQLKTITGLEDMQSICNVWKSIDENLEQVYSRYVQLQKKQQQAEKNILKTHQNIEQEEHKINETNYLMETQLKQTNQQKIERLKSDLKQLQAQFTTLVDINCPNLSTEDIIFYAQRFKNKNKSPKNQMKKVKMRKNTAVSNSGRSRMKNTLKMSDINNQTSETKSITRILELAGKNRDEGIYLLSHQQMRKQNLKYILQ